MEERKAGFAWDGKLDLEGGAAVTGFLRILPVNLVVLRTIHVPTKEAEPPSSPTAASEPTNDPQS